MKTREEKEKELLRLVEITNKKFGAYLKAKEIKDKYLNKIRENW